jgi:hypothetical protein
MFCYTEMVFPQPASGMLKKAASVRRPLFGLSGLSRLVGFSGSSNKTNQIDQTNQINQMNQIDPFRLSRAAILRMAALTALKLPLYPVPVPTL